MNQIKIARIGILSAMRIGFGVGAVLGVAAGMMCGVWFAMGAAVFTSLTGLNGGPAGAFMLLLCPLLGAAGGSLGGMLTGFLGALAFNLWAGLTGGLNLTVEEQKNPDTLSGSEEVY